MREFEKLKKSILNDYPRLGLEDNFKFACHPGVPCFNDCCADINIFLTPYDIIRMKNHLNISSNEFLEKYTLSPIDENQRHPVIMLKMNDDDKKKCPFVTDKGCSIYSDRPWSCRMYPLGLASPSESIKNEGEFYFLMRDDFCKGFEEDGEWTIKGWIGDQGIEPYDDAGKLFKEISLHPFFDSGKSLSPQKIEMLYMVCYDIDRFREFLFESSFFDRFEVDEKTKEQIKNDDVELFGFGVKWLKFSLFGEKTIEIKDEAVKTAKMKKK